MKDLNYLPLNVESNIYNMASLEFDDNSNKILVVTQDCQIYCISYRDFKIKTRGVEFTYIPNKARIMSIGALKRRANDFVIGITHSLATKYYLNIYASGSANFDLDYVAQGCQTIPLKYVPYHLYGTELMTVSPKDKDTIQRVPVWLLSGGDSSIHCFKEDKANQTFNEISIEDSFPELTNIEGLALWIDIVNLDHPDHSHQRAIALGLEDGAVRYFHSVMNRQTELFDLVKQGRFDGYNTITPSVRFFTHKPRRRSRLRQQTLGTEKQEQKLHLLAINSTEPATVFENVINCGLDRRVELPDSQRLDASVSSAIGDINLDGYNEILIGCHGQEMLTYCYDTETSSYHLSEVKELNYPVFAMSILDLTGDAVLDLVLLLSNGILIIQSNVDKALELCRARLDSILKKMK